MTAINAPGPLPRTTAPTRIVPARGPAPVVKALARGADPLPKFATPTDYQNYVINLVGQSRNTQAELEKARKALNGPSNEATKALVETLQERQDALKLQLLLLRDNYAIPAEWTRWKIVGGYGFDKEAFWKDQVEAIPGQEVHVTPAKPKPAPPPPPAPKPAAPTPAAVAPVVAAGGPLSEPLRNLIAGYAADGLRGSDSSAGEAFKRSKMEAMLPILRTSQDPQARQAVQILEQTLKDHGGNYNSTHNAYYVALVGVQALVTTAGTSDEKQERLIERFATEGVQASSSSAGEIYASARLVGVERHARAATDPFSRQIARIVAEVRKDYSGNYTSTHNAYGLALRSALTLHDERAGATPDARARQAAKTFAAEGLMASHSSAGENYARERLKAIVRLATGSTDPGLQAAHALVADTLAKHEGNYNSVHLAYNATFQAVGALLA